jgi:3-phosphoshikimate 1-carboxyvinyltransferase
VRGVKVEPATSLVGALAVPGVKGICQRGVLLGAVADGETVLRGFGHAADTDVALDAVRQLGATVHEEGDTVRIEGVGLRGLRAPDGPVDCRNAGTLLRLMSGLLAGQEGRFDLIGDESLSSRPVRVEKPLTEMGARYETTDGTLPATIHAAGPALKPIRYTLPQASAQVKSSVLLAGLLAESGPTTVVEPVPTRDHTERMLTGLGIRVQRKGDAISVWPADRIPPLDIEIPGDFSSAAPFLVAATLLSGSRLMIHGVNVNPTRTGFLDVLERMGARIGVVGRHSVGGEPVADLDVQSAELVATSIGPSEIPGMVDELPLFALAASMARGESVVWGAEELRVKETDRIATVAESLKALGAHIRAEPDGWRIVGVPARLRGGSMQSSGDHRIAMLGAVAGVLSRDGVTVGDAEAVAVSFPGFFDLLDTVAQRT